MPVFLNPRTALLARHAQHVALIHFPIALFMTGVVFDLLSRGKKDSPLATAAYLNLTGASLSVLPTMFTGLLAWQFALEGRRLHGLLLLHLAGAAVSSVIIICCWRLHRQPRTGRLRVLLEFAGVALLAFTAHLGGWISGVNN